jgi:type IV pilus assembly protein PilC
MDWLANSSCIKGDETVAAFDYIYFDINGKRKKGSGEAADRDKLFKILKAEDKMPVKITEQNMLTKDIHLGVNSPVKARDLAIFCRQFHSILSSGVAMVSALHMLGNETENKVLKKAIKETQKAVEKGESLTQAMGAQPEAFPPIFLHMMEAGELSGGLEIPLQRVAEHYEKEAKLKAIIKKAAIYPVIVSIVSVIVIAVMLIKVIPSFMEMFEDMEIKMPAITMAVVRLSDFMRKCWIILLALGISLAVSVRIFKASDYGRTFLCKF